MAVRDMLRHFDVADRVFASHVMDLFDRVDLRRESVCTCFCDLHQASLVRQIGQAYDLYFVADGGWPEAERVVFQIAQSQWEIPDSPIVAILLKTYHPVTHRDILGSVLGLGIRRDNVGDILKTEEGHVIFVKPPANRVIMDELRRIGREAVSCQMIENLEGITPIREFRQIKGTVMSLRLDSLVSLCAGCSREKGRQMVEKELVTVDAALRSDPAFSFPLNCTLSIRGCGKFLVECSGDKSAKGRYFILANKYI